MKKLILIFLLLSLTACGPQLNTAGHEEVYVAEINRFIFNYRHTLELEPQIVNATKNFGVNTALELKEWTDLKKGIDNDLQLATLIKVPIKYENAHQYVLGFLQRAAERQQRVLVYRVAELEKSNYFKKIDEKFEAGYISKEAIDKEKFDYESKQVERVKVINSLELEIDDLITTLEGLLKY